MSVVDGSGKSQWSPSTQQSEGTERILNKVLTPRERKIQKLMALADRPGTAGEGSTAVLLIKELLNNE